MSKVKESVNFRKEIKVGKFTISLKKIIIFVGIILVLIISFSVFGNKDSEVEPIYDKDNKPVYINKESINDIYSDAEKYKGQFIDISGKVFNKKTEDGITLLQINADVDNSDDNTLIYYQGKTDIKNDDFIKVAGYILGTSEYSNALGGDVSAPKIMSTKLQKSTYLDVARPTIKQVKYSDKVINQSGYKIEITKVEFAKKETRVYVTASNNASDDFSIYTYSAVATQNGKQYEYDSNYDAGYEELSSELKPGITSKGILTFPAMDQSNFTIIIDGSSDNWDIDLKDFKFDLEVK